MSRQPGRRRITARKRRCLAKFGFAADKEIRDGLLQLARPRRHDQSHHAAGVTEEVIRLLPEGIGLIPLFLNIRRGTEDEFAAMMPAYEERIAQLAECGCDLIHPHGAPPFMVQGRKREAEIVRAWEKKYKVPIM